MIQLNFDVLKSDSEKLFYFQENYFELKDGVKYNNEWYPMPITGREMIANNSQPDRPIKQINHAEYTKGVKDGYNRPITTPFDVVLNFVNNAIVPAYVISNGNCESTHSYNYGFEVGKLFNAWEIIINESKKYGKDFNKIIDDYNSQFNTFADLLNVPDKDKQALIDKIKLLLVDAGGVRVANLLYCMEDLKLLKFRIDDRIKNKVYDIIRNEFNFDFVDESVNKQFRVFEPYREKSARKSNLIQKDFDFIKNAIK
ncbi:MAG: hypothetical protein KA206_01000 [Paludibacter sp.]|nr:hypothetical protein [Paludibacter sp.]